MNRFWQALVNVTLESIGLVVLLTSAGVVLYGCFGLFIQAFVIINQVFRGF